MRNRARAITAGETGHTLLHFAAQTSKRVQTAFGKHHRYLIQVVSNHINCMKFGATLIGQLSRNLRCGSRRWSEVCREQHAIQAHFAAAASVFDKIMLRRTNCEHRTRSFRDDLFSG
jgi:hypothetical protein